MTKVGILYDNISGNTGDQAIGISLRAMLDEMGIIYDELIPGRFNPSDYQKIIVGGGYLLQPSPHFFYDKFRVRGPQILNCCGIVQGTVDLDYLSQYEYVSVRSEGDKNKLSYLDKNVCVVPCSSMLLDDLADINYTIKEPSLGIHLYVGAVDEDLLVHYLSGLPFHIYFLPITHYNGDYAYLNKICRQVKGSTLLPILKPREIFTIIGKFNYFVSSSLHGAIFSYRHNVPFVLQGGQEKQIFFMRDRGLSAYLFTGWDNFRRAFEPLVNAGVDYSASIDLDMCVLLEHKYKLKHLLPHGIGSSSFVDNGSIFQVAFLQNEIDYIRHDNQCLHDEIGQLQGHIEELQNSLSMKLSMRYAGLVSKLFGEGGWRRRIYNKVMAWVRLKLMQGL